MEITTDFIPKPGDTIRHRIPSGPMVVFIWILCPDCSKGRWVSKRASNRPSFTGRCKECHIAHAKVTGWPAFGYHAPDSEGD